MYAYGPSAASEPTSASSLLRVARLDLLADVDDPLFVRVRRRGGADLEGLRVDVDRAHNAILSAAVTRT